MSQSPESRKEAWDLAQIRQRPTRLNVNKIGASVRRLMTRSGYGQTQAVEQLQRVWAESVGAALAARSRPGNISRGILNVHVADSPTMQEIYFCKRSLITKLQAAMPEVQIKDIRTRVTAFDPPGA